MIGRRDEQGIEVYHFHPQILQIIQFFFDALQISAVKATDVPALFSFAQILIPVRAFQSIISDLIQQKSGETFLGSLPLFFLAIGCFFGTVLLQSSFYCSGNMFRFLIFLQLLSLADLLFSAFSYTWKASWPVRSLLLLHRSC